MGLTTVGRVARNSVAVSVALLIKRMANFVLFILVARHLGVLVFGQFSLAYTLYIIFEVPAMFGLATLIIREVAKDKSSLDKYLINGHLIVLAASLVSLGIWILLVHMLGYSPEVIKGSYLLGLALIPFAMSSVCEAIFKAFERMQFIAYAFGLANLVKIGLVWLLLSRGFGIMSVIGLLAVIQWGMLLVEWYFIYRYFSKPSWVIDPNFCWKLAKASVTFLGIGIFAVLFLRMNVIILSKLDGEISVGYYNAAFQLTYVFMLLSRSLKEAVYPVFSRIYMTNIVRFREYTERSIEFLISLALPMVVFFFFLSGSILLVYREEFVAAAPVLQVLGCTLIPVSFERILGGVLLASGRQKVTLAINAVNTISLLVLSVVMIKGFGVLGAGLSLLASLVISFALHYGFVSRRVFPVSIPRIVWKPVVSSLFLVGFLALISKSNGLLLVISSAIVLYGLVLFGLNVLFGGLREPVKAWLGGGKTKPGARRTET
jgi:O-antigen/teichoic acid export membrane protein